MATSNSPARNLIAEFKARALELGIECYAIILRDPDELTDHVRTGGSNIWLMGAGMEITEDARLSRVTLYEEDGEEDDEEEEFQSKGD